eukprot:Platyproteum_vivax@DN6141_c0_g2_i1.p1
MELSQTYYESCTKDGGGPQRDDPLHSQEASNEVKLCVSTKTNAVQPVDAVQQADAAQQVDAVEQVYVRFQRSSNYPDWIWAFLFFFHMLSVVVYIIIKCIEAPTSSFDIRKTHHVWILLVSFIPVSIWSATWISALRRFGKSLVAMALIASPLILFIGGITCRIVLKTHIFSIPIYVLVVTQVYYAFLVATKASFSAQLIETSGEALKPHTGILVLAMSTMMFGLLWLLILGVGVLAMIGSHQIGWHPSHYSLSMWLVIGCMFLSLYWTHEVLGNIVHTTVAAIVTTWYFHVNTAAEVAPYTTWDILTSSVVHSAGSICLGSLLVALAKTATTLIAWSNYLLNQYHGVGRLQSHVQNCISGFLVFLLSILELSLQWFNMYAFTHVAMYGKSYSRAVRDTAKLIHLTGMEVLTHHDITSAVVIFGGLIGAGISAAFAAILSTFTTASTSTTMYIAAASFGLGYYGTSSVSAVIFSAVTSLFICYAEEPRTLLEINPKLYSFCQDALNRSDAEPDLEMPLIREIHQAENETVLRQPYHPPPTSLIYC